MSYITIKDEGGKVKPALLFSHCQLNHLYGTITKARDIEDDAKRKAMEIEQRKELSHKMADTWENTYINMRKMRFEKRRERLINEQKYKEKRFEELRIESEKLKKKINEKAKEAFFFEQDSCKALHSAFRRSETEAERLAQLEFNEKLRRMDREIETKYAESVKNDAKRFQEEEEEKKRTLAEEKARLKIVAKETVNEAESRKKAEKERLQREEREDMALLERQMKQVIENEKKETLRRTVMVKNSLIANREEVKRHKEKIKEQDDQENKALEIIANGKITMAKIRRLKEFEMMESKNARLKALSNKLSSENEERERKEYESMKRAEEERYKLEMDAKERERQYREMLKQERINEHLKYMKDQEEKLAKEKELLKWEILKRFRKEEINNKFTMTVKEKKRKKALEFRQTCRDQIESDIDRRMKEKEIELQACQRAQELWELNDKEFLVYAESVREESKAKGRPLYPLDAAIYNYKRNNGLLDKKRNFIWDATIRRPKGIEDSTYQTQDSDNLQNCLTVQAISADEFGCPKRANGIEPSITEEKSIVTTVVATTVPAPLDDWLEKDLWGFRRWHVIFMFCSGFLSIVVCICCCCRFRIPRTKQEIEADHIRNKLTRKFRNQLKMLQNSEMDEMDLKRALDRIRAEFKSDTESLAQSDAFSVRSLPRSGADSPPRSCRKASEIGVDIDDLIKENEWSSTRNRRYSRLMNNTMTFIRKNRTPISINT